MFTEGIEQVPNVGYVRRLAMVCDDAVVGGLVADGAEGLSVVFFYEDAVLTVGASVGAAGVGSMVKVAVGVPRVTADLLKWLRLNAEKRWVLWAEDGNGDVMKIGGDGDGCVMSCNAEIAIRNGYELSWEWAGGDVPEFVNEKIDDIMAGVKSIDLRKYKGRDIYLVGGDTLRVEFEFELAGGVLEVLTGSTFLLEVRAVENGPVLFSITQGGGFAFEAGNTKLVLSRTAAQTAAWAKGQFVYTMVRTFADTTKDTIFKGKWVVE
jgi:hypothetical protein